MTAGLAALADAEPVEYLDLQPRKEMGHPVARHKHCAWLPLDRAAYRPHPHFIGVQESGKRLAFEKPGDLVAAGTGRCLQRTQDRQCIEFGDEEQVARHDNLGSAGQAGDCR
jgi:hypothetical protein